MSASMFYGTPFRDLRRLQEEMERLTRSATSPQGFHAINVYAHQDGIVITAELPGVNEDDLDISGHRDAGSRPGKRQYPTGGARRYRRRARRNQLLERPLSLP